MESSKINKHPLLLPIALWNQDPIHQITCCQITFAATEKNFCSPLKNHSYDDIIVLTGSLQGQICSWRFRNHVSIEQESIFLLPISFMLAHSTKIVSIGLGFNEIAKRIMCSISSDGTLCSWSIDTQGNTFILESKKVFFLECLSPIGELEYLSNQRHIIVTGSCGYAIVDSWNLQLLCQKDWIDSLLKLSSRVVCSRFRLQSYSSSRTIETWTKSFSSPISSYGMVWDSVFLVYEALVSCLLLRLFCWSQPRGSEGESMREIASWKVSWNDSSSILFQQIIDNLQKEKETEKEEYDYFDHPKDSLQFIKADLSSESETIFLLWSDRWCVIPLTWMTSVHQSFTTITTSISSSMAYGMVQKKCNSSSFPCWMDGKFLNERMLLLCDSSSYLSIISLELSGNEKSIQCVFVTSNERKELHIINCSINAIQSTKLISKSSNPFYHLSLSSNKLERKFSNVLQESCFAYFDEEQLHFCYLTHESIIHSTDSISIQSMYQEMKKESLLEISCRLLLKFDYDNCFGNVLIEGYNNGRIIAGIVSNKMTQIDLNPILDEESAAITCLGHVELQEGNFRFTRVHSGVYESSDASTTTSSVSQIIEKIQTGFEQLMTNSFSRIIDPGLNESIPSTSLNFDGMIGNETSCPIKQIVVLAGNSHGSLSAWILLTDATTACWTLSSEKLNTFHRFHLDSITQISIAEKESNLGQLVAVIGRDKKVSIWRLTPPNQSTSMIELNCLHELQGHEDQIFSVTWKLIINYLLVHCISGRIYVWNLTTGSLERCLPHSVVHMPINYTNSSLRRQEKDIYNTLSLNNSAVQVMNIDCLSSCPIQLVVYNIDIIGKTLHRLWKESKNNQNNILQILQLLCYLLCREADLSLDAMSNKYISKCHGNFSYGLMFTQNVEYDTNGLSLFFPWECTEKNRWKISSYLSATLQLSLVSLCLHLIEEEIKGDHKYNHGNDEDNIAFQIFLSRVITYHSIIIPENYSKDFIEPSLEMLSYYGIDQETFSGVEKAAQLILQNVLQHFDEVQKAQISAEWSARLQHSHSLGNLSKTISHQQKLASQVLILASLGIDSPQHLSPQTARQVCDLLVQFLETNSRYACLAAQLLNKGLALWRPHLSDFSSLVHTLITHTLSSSSASRISLLASKLLLELGVCEPSLFISSASSEINRLHNPSEFQCAVIQVLVDLMLSHGLVLSRHLSKVVETILLSLDPTKPDRRKSCLVLATKALHQLVKSFPMVTFHQNTQRLALGTMEGLIVIYDLRTATKWRLLSGHTSSLSALLFSPNGQELLSYAAKESCVRFWTCGNGGLFGGLLGMQQTCHRKINLEPISPPRDLHEIMKRCCFSHLNNKMVQLIREDQTIQQLSFS